MAGQGLRRGLGVGGDHPCLRPHRARGHRHALPDGKARHNQPRNEAMKTPHGNIPIMTMRRGQRTKPVKRFVRAFVAVAALCVGAATAQETERQGPAPLSAFTTWLAAQPARAAEFAAFERFLATEGVKDVVAPWQLIRTATSWRQCGDPFAIPERRLWPNIVPALVFIRDRIAPVIGPVEPVAVFRDEAMNRCAGGAPGSVHRRFAALDLVPVRPLALADLTAALCPIHAAHGPWARIGLGFYTGRRFHIDAGGFRTWGPDSRRVSSPCLAPR